MTFFFDHIEDMSGEDRDRFLKEIRRDGDTLADYSAWKAVAQRVRFEQDELLGDTRVLVAYALERAGRSPILEMDVRRHVDATRFALDEAVRTQPAVADIVRQIQKDATLFEAEWDQAFRREHRSDRASHHRRSGAGPVRIGWRVAAVTAAIVFASILMFVVARERSRVTVQVASGVVEKLSMRDGSNVRLVGPAVLSYVPSDVRPSRVELSGNAYFDVVAGLTPFTIETATARISVLGTNFGLRSSAESTEVVLANGRLSVSGMTGDPPVILVSGFASTVARGSMPSVPQRVDLAGALSWAGLFVFSGTRMEDVADALAAHYGIPVTLDPVYNDQMVSGTFDSADEPRKILQVLATSLGARVVSERDGLRLTSAR